MSGLGYDDDPKIHWNRRCPTCDRRFWPWTRKALCLDGYFYCPPPRCYRDAARKYRAAFVAATFSPRGERGSDR